MRTPTERFFSKVAFSDETECWLWVAGHDNKGYGQFWHEAQRKAHRVAYEWLVGPIPDGLVIDHLCRNHACVNPAHMEPVTNAENVRRGAGVTGTLFGPRTECPNGHAYSAENTRMTPRGRRCKTCHRASKRVKVAA